MPTVVVLQDKSSSRPPGVTVLPEEEDEIDPTKWIEEHPVVVGIIGGSILLLLIIVIVFYCIRKKRLASLSKEVDLNSADVEAEIASSSQSVTDPPDQIIGESFLIIQSPNMHAHKKRKSTLAVPPAFSVSHNKRKSAPSAPVVGWGRWSNAGLEIHSSQPNANNGNPMSKAYARKKRQSTPGIMMAVPMVYRNRPMHHRRASHAPTHAVHFQESEQLPPRPRTP